MHIVSLVDLLPPTRALLPSVSLVFAGCEPPAPPLLYTDALQRYLLSSPLTPPTFSLPAPAPLQFVLAAPPLRPPPNPETVEAFVLEHPELQPLVERLAATKLQNRKRRGPSERTPEHEAFGLSSL